MRRIGRKHVLAAVLGAALASAPAGRLVASEGAAPPPASWHTASDLSLWGVGAALDMTKRDLKLDGGPSVRLDASTVRGILSCDALDWLAVVLGAGQTAVSSPVSRDDESGSMWMAGIEANLWAYPLESPSFLASLLRLRGSLSWRDHRVSEREGDLSWTEVRGALLLQSFFENEPVMKDSPTYPHGIAFFAGPLFSVLNGRTPRSGFREARPAGAMVGADLFLTETVRAGYAVQSVGGISHTLSLTLHF